MNTVPIGNDGGESYWRRRGLHSNGREEERYCTCLSYYGITHSLLPVRVELMMEDKVQSTFALQKSTVKCIYMYMYIIHVIDNTVHLHTLYLHVRHNIHTQYMYIVHTHNKCIICTWHAE